MNVSRRLLAVDSYATFTRRLTTLIGLAIAFVALLALTGCERTAHDIANPGVRASIPLANVPEIATRGGEWVVITVGQGKSGDKVASSWYLLRFRDDGTAKLLWSTPGHYARERVQYNQTGDVVTISGSVEAPQVNGVPFTLGPNDSMVASIQGLGGGDNLSFTHRGTVWPYVHWALIFVGLTLAYLAWRQWKWFTPIVVGAGVIVLSIYWANVLEDMPMFRWVKNYTLVLTIWIFWTARHTSLTKYVWMRFLCAAILGLNIFEACKVDFLTGYLPNMLNGAAGILSILAMTRWMGIGPNSRPTKDLIWAGQPHLWIICYDIWNIAFSYLNFNEYTSNSIALNVVATLLALWIAGTWVSTRGVTLGVFYLYLFTFNLFVMEKSFVPVPISNTSALTVATISFVTNLVLCLCVWRWKLFKKAPAWPSFGQYRHAEHEMVGPDDSIHVNLDKIPALADYPPGETKEESEKAKSVAA